MFSQIFDAIEEWMRELLTGMITSNLDTMFTDVNQKTGEIATQVGQTPQGWNGSIFSMIRNLSDSVIMPIAGIIITLVLCYELISMLTERNNMHDIDTWMFFKYFVKMWIAVYLVTISLWDIRSKSCLALRLADAYMQPYRTYSLSPNTKDLTLK